jgi:tRNA-Thr(GGU) m(6)t(6)A37 methyltransferase TsaA
VTSNDDYALRPIGVVRSPLRTRSEAPRQGTEGAPEAWVELEPDYAETLSGVTAGDEILLLTWLHQSRREVLQVHPRGDRTKPLTGVFATRSPCHFPRP